jgi:hypothetical protein
MYSINVTKYSVKSAGSGRHTDHLPLSNELMTTLHIAVSIALFYLHTLVLINQYYCNAKQWHKVNRNLAIIKYSWASRKAIIMDSITVPSITRCVN